jgi:hypothetical protein
VAVTPAPKRSQVASLGVDLAGEPCQSAAIWPRTLYVWEVPIGCYGKVYWEGKGDCFGWVRYLHPNIMKLKVHTAPKVGAVAWFKPGTSYGGRYGHYAQVIAIKNGWLFISEENMYWRGGGYNKVTFRYIPIHSDILYLY